MIVADASLVTNALLRRGSARGRLAQERVHVPHLVDTEVCDALQKLALRGSLDDRLAGSLLSTWSRLGVTRHPAAPVAARVWELRHNLSAYDATYVALAERLQLTLVTADARLASATGVACRVEVVPG